MSRPLLLRCIRLTCYTTARDPWYWEAHETARVHYAARRRGRVAARGARAAARPDGGLDYGVAPLGSKQLGRIDGGIALDPNPKNRWCRGNCLSGCLAPSLAFAGAANRGGIR